MSGTDLAEFLLSVRKIFAILILSLVAGSTAWAGKSVSSQSAIPNLFDCVAAVETLDDLDGYIERQMHGIDQLDLSIANRAIAKALAVFERKPKAPIKERKAAADELLAQLPTIERRLKLFLIRRTLSQLFQNENSMKDAGELFSVSGLSDGRWRTGAYAVSAMLARLNKLVSSQSNFFRGGNLAQVNLDLFNVMKAANMWKTSAFPSTVEVMEDTLGIPHLTRAQIRNFLKLAELSEPAPAGSGR